MQLRLKLATGMVWMLIGAILATGAESFDWPQFRGPNHDGISKETAWNPAALAGGPKVAWKANVGQGWSGVSVYGDMLFTMGNVDGQDIVYAMNIKDGKEVWRHAYACRPGNYPGPRSTPTTDGKVVYTVSRDGLVLCLNIADGKVLWQKNVISDLGAANITWGIAGSAVIHGDNILVNAGESGIALDRKTGAKVWGSSGQGGYSTPVVFKRGASDSVALFGCKGLYIVDAKTGTKQGSSGWETKYDVNAADPVPSNGKVFISSGYDRGCSLVDVSGASPKTLWTHTGMRNHFSSSVLIDGNLYGVDGNAGGGSLKCMDFNTGKEKWSKSFGFGNLMAAGDKLIMLNESGDLFILKASPAGVEEISSAKGILGKTCWTAPVLCRGVIYCRNSKGDIVAIDVSK